MDLLAMSRHDALCREDYQLLKELGIKTVREGLSWSGIDNQHGHSYDFNRFEKMMAIGAEEGMQQIWDLNHFDYPDDIDPFSPEFVERFARYAAKAITLIKQYQPDQVYIVPINEISFFTFIAGSRGVWAPYAIGRGQEFKRQLVRASIAAMNAIWSVDSTVRFIQVDPIFRRVPTEPITPAKELLASQFVVDKFQAFDLLTGKVEPELGGDPKYLDLIGANYYLYNQEWITGEDPKKPETFKTIQLDEPGRVSVVELLREVYDRYQRPIIISETGSWGTGRPEWWRRLTQELLEAERQGFPLLGVCAYPIVDRPDWTEWHLTNSGLWDFKADDLTCKRYPHQETIAIVQKYIGEHAGS
jgi:beta-glucosidase/6-phospho-beta-glucosidase/beta-galactosidase